MAEVITMYLQLPGSKNYWPLLPLRSRSILILANGRTPFSEMVRILGRKADEIGESVIALVQMGLMRPVEVAHA
jgi:hypothetical protein